MGIEKKAFLGKLDGGLKDGFPGELAEAVMGQGQAAHGAGNADDAMAVKVVVFLEHCLGGGGGRGLAIIDDGGLPLGRVNQHEAPTADVARRRMRNRKGEGGGDGRVDRIATFLQDGEPGSGSRRRHRNDHAAAIFGRFFASGKVARKNRQQGDAKQGTEYHGNIH